MKFGLQKSFRAVKDFLLFSCIISKRVRNTEAPLDRDAENYKNFLDGDDSAFDRLMESLFYRLVYFVDGIVGDTFAAEDIAVDVFAELIANKKRYNFKTSLKTYVFMLGKSRALNYIKHRKVLDITELSGAEGLPEEKAELEKKVLQSERERILGDALDMLPQDKRMALHLIYFEDMSYEQAARVMGVEKKYLDNLLQRAKKELRSL